MTLEDALIVAVGALGTAVVSLAAAVAFLWRETHKSRDRCDQRIDALTKQVFELQRISCVEPSCDTRRSF